MLKHVFVLIFITLLMEFAFPIVPKMEEESSSMESVKHVKLPFLCVNDVTILLPVLNVNMGRI